MINTKHQTPGAREVLNTKVAPGGSLAFGFWFLVLGVLAAELPV
jgi:hypothetical protein